ncbi:MAG TPA: hypothetical protein VMS76_20055 [Planctomycetota bacterium]|nr:hypothetical protein [Planctomycetota bacterium]
MLARWLTSAAPLLLAAGFGAASIQVPPSAAPQAAEVPAATLEEIYADPAGWLGRRARVVFQLQGPLESWNPGMTRFGAADYAAVRAWADGQRLWEPKAYEQPIAVLFARRGTPAQAVLAAGAPYARFEAHAHVRQAFFDRPWIEIDELKPLPHAWNEGALVHAGRAAQLMEAGEWALAQEDLARALASELPEHVRTELERLRESCVASQGGRRAR